MFQSIRTKIFITTLPVLIFVIAASLFFIHGAGKSVLESEISKRIQSQQTAQILKIQSRLDHAEELARVLGTYVENSFEDTELHTYVSSISSAIQEDDLVLGAGIWFEPYRYNAQDKYVGPYVYRQNGSLITTYDYEDESYDYLSQAFYTEVKDKGEVLFTDFYYDQTSALYMLTCSYPMYTQEQFIGCVTIDIELTEMQNFISGLVTDEGESAYLINEKGIYLAASNMNLVKEGVSIEDDPDTKAIHDEILDHDAGSISLKQDGEPYVLYYKTVPGVDWKVLYLVETKSILESVYLLLFIVVVIGIVAVIFIAANIMIVVGRNILRPINLLVIDFELIASNEFTQEHTQSLIKRRDEFGKLGRSLHDMKTRLWEYQKELLEALEENIAATEELTMQNEVITDREAQLRVQSAYNKSIIEVIPDVLFIMDKEGRFLDCQSNAQSSLYMPKEIFIGKRLIEVMPEEIARQGMDKIQRAYDTGEVQSFTYEISIAGQEEYYEMRIMKGIDNKVVAIARRITEEHDHLLQIEYLSYHDQITGLYNRRYFDEELLNLEQENNYPITVTFADVNGLKLINDSFGHHEGDQLLKKFAKVLKETCGTRVLAARIGGDEFALIMTGADEEEMKELIRQIDGKCKKENVNAIALSVSFGWATVYSSRDSMREALKLAEDRMYQKKLFEGPSRRGKTIEVIVSTLQEKNPREEQHSHRVSELCEKMAEELGMSKEEKKKIKSAGLLHDIGKIGIPETLLNKPGKLTEEEYKDICRHPEIGYRILQSAPDMTDIANIVLSHHERYDGKGYPRKIAGKEIPYVARMIAIVDAFDAMTSQRSYRNPMSEKDAAKEVLANAGSQFDPELAELFVRKVLGYKE